MARYAPAAFTAAQTDTVVAAVGTGEHFVLVGYEFMVSKGCTVNVSFNLEFEDTADVNLGGHPGLAPGSGVVVRESGSEPLATGAEGQDLTITCSVPTGGSCTIVVNGRVEAIA